MLALMLIRSLEIFLICQIWQNIIIDHGSNVLYIPDYCKCSLSIQSSQQWSQSCMCYHFKYQCLVMISQCKCLCSLHYLVLYPCPDTCSIKYRSDCSFGEFKCILSI